MATKEAAKDATGTNGNVTQAPDLDQDGIAIQQYQNMVLVVIPGTGFGEQALRFTRSALENSGIGTRSVSTCYDETVRGRLQDEFLVDEKFSDQTMEDYAGIFIGAGETDELATNEHLLRLLREAEASGKAIATFGNGLEVLARAGVVKGKKVTGSPASVPEAKMAGARYTGRQLEVSGVVITALDESAGLRLGRALARIVQNHS